MDEGAIHGQAIVLGGKGLDVIMEWMRATTTSTKGEKEEEESMILGKMNNGWMTRERGGSGALADYSNGILTRPVLGC